MQHLGLVKLAALMTRSRGIPEIGIGLIDGPVVTAHADLAESHIREISGHGGASCATANSKACLHGTFVAGILVAGRNSPAPAICPDCTLLVRPIFAERTTGSEQMPSATPQELAAAIVDCIGAGARVINLSLALAQFSTKGEPALEDALSHAARRGAIVVAAAGNQGAVGGSVVTRHPGVIPVTACNQQGRPMTMSNLGGSIGRRGLSAPGEGITSVGAEGQPLTLGGTSVAVPFVTGAIGLLWSEFPAAGAAEIKFAVTQAYASRRASVVPPLLDAWASYQFLLRANSRRRVA